MSSASSPRRHNGANGSILRLHPRGPPPLHVGHASLPPATSAGYPYVSLPHPTRMSPRQVKLQRMEPSPPYTIALPLRKEVSNNFCHELFRFHQMLRDAVEAKRRDDVHEKFTISRHDHVLLDILTSDRGDAVVKEFFARWQHFVRGDNVKDSLPSDVEDMGRMLWDVLETLFANLPLVMTEAEAGGSSSSKVFLRYMDSLNSLRDLLLALLFKRSTDGDNDDIEDDSEDEDVSGMHSSFGLGFGLDFRGRTKDVHSSPRSMKASPGPVRSRGRIPLYLYCQQLEKELKALRRRVSHERPGSPGVRGLLSDVGLLQDSTVALLLDFWGLPPEERLAFLYQIASQAQEQDASAILHVFLNNCTTPTFLQVWEVLQQAPQFQKMLREAMLLMDPAARDETPTSNALTSKIEKEEVALEMESTSYERPQVSSKSHRGNRKQGRRSTRAVDLNGITEAFDDKESDGESPDENEDDRKNSRAESRHGSPRFPKFTIRERGRLSVSDANGHADEEDTSDRRGSDHQNDCGSQRLAVKEAPPPLDRESVPILQLLRNDLTEVIKMKDGPNVRVMDAVWQLLDVLDGPRAHDPKSSYYRPHMAVPASAAVVPVPPLQTQQQQVVQTPRTVRTPFTAEQQFLMKLDQLQSTLVALGDVRVHTMSTETITGIYRRIPILVKLFGTLTDTSLSAAGIDTEGGGMSKIATSYGKPQVASPWQDGLAKDKLFGPSLAASEVQPRVVEEKVREDVEAMGLLLVKLSKFVRELALLVDDGEAAPSSSSASNDVLTIMELADKLENAGALVETSAFPSNMGSKRRLSLAVDKELPVILAVQSLAHSNQFDDVSRLIARAVNSKVVRVRNAVAGSKAVAEEDDGSDEEGGDVLASEKATEAARIVKKFRQRSLKTAQLEREESQVQLQRDIQSATSEEEAVVTCVSRVVKGDIPMFMKTPAALRGTKLFSVDILLRIVNQLYRDNYESTVSTLQYGNRRMEFSEFTYEWHIRKYGLKALAQRHLLKLIQSLRKHEKKVFLCQLCLRFMGIQDSLGFHELKFVLGLLSRWSVGTFSGSSKIRLELSKRQFKIRLASAIPIVHEALRERFGAYARGMDALADRIKAQALAQDDEFIRESDLLTLCVDEFESQRMVLEKALGAVYLAGDINGDGSLEFDEFTSVVTHLSPTLDDRFLQKVFEAAHDFTKPHRISFARFLDVILLERILNPALLSATTSTIARTKTTAVAATASSLIDPNSVGSSSSSQPSNIDSKTVAQDEQEETYQLELLCETWTHDREAVIQVLQASIAHAPTAKSLTDRLVFLNQLLERRVDSKTAWLCHRQIMREIARYQNLDEEQIAGLRRKERQFKNAVRAIYTTHRLGAHFVVGPTSRESAEDNADIVETSIESPLPLPNYTTMVQNSLEEESRGIANAANVTALENELRETFLERADEGSIDDFKKAVQHLRRATVIEQESIQLLLQSQEELSDKVMDKDEEDDIESKENEDEDQEVETE